MTKQDQSEYLYLLILIVNGVFAPNFTWLYSPEVLSNSDLIEWRDSGSNCASNFKNERDRGPVKLHVRLFENQNGYQ